MVLVGVLWGAFHESIGAVIQEILDSAGEAVTLCITMLDVISLWTGVLKVGERAGSIEQLSKRMKLILHFLFLRTPGEHPVSEHIATSIVANILGPGWAATPAGLRAMKALKDLEERRRTQGSHHVERGTADNETCTFLIINILPLQLIPINTITYRSQYGSISPTAIVDPTLIATLVSTVVGVIFVRLMDGS